MAKVAKTKVPNNGEQYKAHGWKKVSNSATSTFFTSTIPVQIKNSMIEANKQKRVLSTGSVFVGYLSRENSENVTSGKSAKKH